MKKLSLIAGALLLAATPVWADEAKPDFASEKLLGDFSGMRTEMFDKGYTLDVVYKGELWRNLSGGAAKGGRGDGNLDIKLTVDGEKALDLGGTTFFAYFLGNHGGRINDIAGTFGGITNIETPTHAVKLYELWGEKSWAGGRFSVLLGLHDLNSEFYVTDTSGLFINPAAGISTEMSATGDNGPSIFPTTSLAARVAFKPTEKTYVKAAAFDAVPGNPNNPRGTHIRLGDGEGALLVAEGGVEAEDTGKFGVGAWKYTASKPDQLTGESAKRHGIYFLADRSVYGENGKDVSLFGRIGFTNGDVDAFKRGWEVGAVASGFVPCRPDAQLGAAVYSVTTSDKFNTVNTPVGGTETQVELTYRDKLRPGVFFQPDIQYTIDPGTDPSQKNALTVGVRLEIDF